MKKLFLTLVISLIASSGYAQTYTVERVIDGDTLKLTTGEEVQLIGVKVPENVKMGQDATEFVKKIFEFYPKEIILGTDAQERDRDGRLLAYVFIETGFTKDEVLDIPVPGSYYYMYRDDKEVIFLNATIVDNGYARPTTVPPNVKYADLFQELYEEARENKRGLWKDEGLTEEQRIELARKYVLESESAKNFMEEISLLTVYPVDKTKPLQSVEVNENIGLVRFIHNEIPMDGAMFEINVFMDSEGKLIELQTRIIPGGNAPISVPAIKKNLDHKALRDDL